MMKLLTIIKIHYLSSLMLASLLLVSGCQSGDKVTSPSTQVQPSIPTQTQKPTNTQADAETVIIPGERVGAVTGKSTKQDLVKLFGESSLKDKTISGPEGQGSFAATEVNLSPEKSFVVIWTDEKQTKPREVRNLGVAWRTPEGIGVGTTWTELKQKLGEFEILGLGWDYGGYIKLEKSKLAQYEGKLRMYANSAPDASQKFPQDYQAVVGDQTFSSTNGHWEPLGMRVTDMIVMLNSQQ